ncbi:hypothetical protein ACH4VR_04495 [Streptomyces sp. NPDC020883]|nr:hypothetical protein [Streptomyces sp. BHT-5-2]
MTMFTASRNGEFDVNDSTSEAVIGHPAKTVQEVLEAAVRPR